MSGFEAAAPLRTKPLKSLNNSILTTCEGGHGSGYMGLAATTWIPMGARVPVLSPNDRPNPSHG